MQPVLPEVSIVIPVFDEEGILHASIVDLRERLGPHGLRYEILLAENGSTDGTIGVARDLCVVPLLYYSYHNLVSDKVKGFEENVMDVHPTRYLSKE